MLYKQAISRHQASVVAAKSLQFSPYNVINIQIISQKPLHHNSRYTCKDNPRASGLKDLESMKVEIVEKKLRENGWADTGHVLSWEATKGNENHSFEFGVPIQKTENWPWKKQDYGSKKAATFEGNKHEVREKRVVFGGAQKCTV